MADYSHFTPNAVKNGLILCAKNVRSKELPRRPRLKIVYNVKMFNLNALFSLNNFIFTSTRMSKKLAKLNELGDF